MSNANFTNVSFLSRIYSQINSSRQGRYGMIIVGVMILLIIIGPYISPYDPTSVNLAPARSAGSWQHWLGTDGLGRDVLSRVLSGGRSIVMVPLISVGIGYFLAGFLTIWGVYKGGLPEQITTRIFEVLLAFPTLLKTLLFVAAFGSGTFVLVIALVFSTMPGASRVIRGVILIEINKDYVLSAQTRGEKTAYILFKELMPNVLTPVASDFSLRITWAIIALSTLSFLGLGVQPPTPDWGLMIQEARSALQENPWAAFVPAFSIGILSLGFSFLADALSDPQAR